MNDLITEPNKENIKKKIVEWAKLNRDLLITEFAVDIINSDRIPNSTMIVINILDCRYKNDSIFYSNCISFKLGIELKKYLNTEFSKSVNVRFLNHFQKEVKKNDQ